MEEMKTQTIGGKTFEIVDAQARETLEKLQKEGLPGSPGATFTPAVSDDGTLSWTNDKELDNPAPVNIMGPVGPAGATGPAPVKGVDYWTPADQAAIEDYLDNALAERTGLMVNFSIVRYSTEEELQAATPASNTIGVITENPITKSVFSPLAPENPAEGTVWFRTGVAGLAVNTLAAPGVEFGSVYVVYASQYVGGDWVSKTSKRYDGGEWADLWGGELYKDGNQYAHITGGWWNNTELYYKTSSTYLGKEVDLNTALGDHIAIEGSVGLYCVSTRNKFDLSEYTELRYDVITGTTAGHDNVFIHSFEAGDLNGGSVAKASGGVILLEGITGEYYITVGTVNARKAYIGNLRLI